LDNNNKNKRSKIMASIHSKNTKPEMILRRALWKQGLRYRIHYGPEKIDVAFSKRKIAIFIDGCFWHSCPDHSHTPKTRKEYWIPKLSNNKRRDVEKTFRLENNGWTVMRFWEHELKDEDKLNAIINRITKQLKRYA
jgi:DNA mismatch endonuclease, patch repair protein